MNERIKKAESLGKENLRPVLQSPGDEVQALFIGNESGLVIITNLSAILT